MMSDRCQMTAGRAVMLLTLVGMPTVAMLSLSGCGEGEERSAELTKESATPSSPGADGELPIMFPAPEIKLTDQDGEAFSSEQLEGQVWVADFIFTRCPGPCPLMTQNMKKLHDEFSETGELRFVSITVDPEYDTPEVLSRYARRHRADTDRWFFLTGEREAIVDLSVEGFKLAASTGDTADDPSHPIVHSQRFVLVDREGNIRGYYNGLETGELSRLRRDLRRLLDRE